MAITEAKTGRRTDNSDSCIDVSGSFRGFGAGTAFLRTGPGARTL
jgi:hypothetical protein